MKRAPFRMAGKGGTWRAAMLAAALLAACSSDDAPSGGQPDEPPAAQPLALTILHINDHHSSLEARNRTLRLRNAAGEPVDVDVEAGGFARVTRAFRELSAGAEHVLKLHAGDALTGTLYYSRAGEIGEADAAMMNTVCFDAFTLGNHEFDKGDLVLRGWLELLRSGECQTAVLSANARFGAASALSPARAPGLVQPYAVFERGGQKIGVVGLTIAGKTKSSSSPDPDTQFEDETVAAQRAIDALRAQGIEHIVLLSHIGYPYDRQIVAQLSGVDVVIGGDSHSLLGPDTMAAYGVGNPAGAYGETLKNRDGEPVCIAQAWEYGQVVGELRVEFDDRGRVTRCAGTPHVLIGDRFVQGGLPASEADSRAFAADAAASGFLRITAPDAQAETVLGPYRDSLEMYKKTVVGTAPVELCSRRVPGGPGSVDYARSSAACNAEGNVAVHGGDIQQLVAHGYLEVANRQYGGADISLVGGGSVRVPLQGDVTAARLLEVLPFDNSLWLLTITGAEARAMIEDGLDAVFRPGGTTGPYPYAGGLRWDVDATRPKGSRANNFEVFDRVSGAWVPLRDEATYRLFVASFNVMGGDGYTTLANVPAERRMDVGVQDVDAFMTYVESLPRDSRGLPVIGRLDPAMYSTRSFVGPAAD